MKTHVAIYNSQKEAMDALEKLTEKKFPVDKLSVIERADVIEDHIKVKSITTIKTIPIVVFTVIGMILGVLASMNTLTFPGFEFLEEVPIVIGGFVGFDIGLIIGAIVVISIAAIVKKDKTIGMEKHVESTKFLIVVDGQSADIIQAERILNTEGSHNYKLVCTYCNPKKASMLKTN